MKQSVVFRLGIAFTTAAMLIASGPAAAQGGNSSNNKGSHSDHRKDDHGKGHHGKGHHHDDLQAKIAALEKRVGRLEGHLTQADLVGTYRWGYLQVAIGEDAVSGRANHLEHNVVAGTLTLSANGVAAFSGRERGFAAGLPGPTPRQERINDQDEFTATWAYTGGAIVLTVTGDDGQPENVNFVGGVGGRMFFTATANPLDGTTTFIIITKDL